MSPRRSKSAVVDEHPSQQVDGAKRAVLDKAVGDILKRFGEGSIMPLGQAHGMVTESFPTGSLSLDIALGVGGIPRGRITEIYGPESSGKTTICQHIVAEAQRMGGTAAFIDMEHALDPVYAARVGVDIDNLLVSQPDNAELRRVFFFQIRIQGSTMGTREELKGLVDFMDVSGVRPLVDRTLPLAQAREGFAAVAAGDVFGKVVFTV